MAHDDEHTYLFPHYIVLGHIGVWTVLELLAFRVWPIRVSCKKISLLHCILAFLLSSLWLGRRFLFGITSKDGDQQEDFLPLYNFSTPGTFEHQIISFSMAYFIVDMPFCLTFHRTFIVHHLLCIVAFGAIQGYWKYLPESTPFFMDFMAWDTTPSIDIDIDIDMTMMDESKSPPVRVQLLLGGLNGVFNLWMAELGGVFFHINRAFQDTDMELPSRGLFLFMFVLTRCCIWPLYLWHLYNSQAQLPAKDHTYFHKASVVVETGLFLTNLHFLYKNIAPIYRTGRMIPDKPAEFHRRWLDQHPTWKRFAGLFVHSDKLSMHHDSEGPEFEGGSGKTIDSSSLEQKKKK